jgi:prevent-host-death family protein
METVGAYEAKTHLSKLLDRVAKGERIAIERHGVPIAVLQPVATARTEPVEDTITALRHFRTGHSLNGVSIRELVEEGRR